MLSQMRRTDARRRPVPFEVVVCTADRQKKTGGKILDLRKVILLSKQPNPDRYLILQYVGSKDKLRVHLDLILFFNNLEVV